MAFDFKKEYKEFYLPKTTPEIVDVPPMNYIAVRGCGDPNQEDGAYQQAVGILYALAYTMKSISPTPGRPQPRNGRPSSATPSKSCKGPVISPGK